MFQKILTISISVLLIVWVIFLGVTAKSALCGERKPASGSNPIINAFDNMVWQSIDGACQILHLK